jgi:hypothetical protein
VLPEAINKWLSPEIIKYTDMANQDNYNGWSRSSRKKMKQLGSLVSRPLALLVSLSLALPSPALALRNLEIAQNATGLEELRNRLLEEQPTSTAGLEEDVDSIVSEIETVGKTRWRRVVGSTFQLKGILVGVLQGEMTMPDAVRQVVEAYRFLPADAAARGIASAVSTLKFRLGLAGFRAIRLAITVVSTRTAPIHYEDRIDFLRSVLVEEAGASLDQERARPLLLYANELYRQAKPAIEELHRAAMAHLLPRASDPTPRVLPLVRRKSVDELLTDLRSATRLETIQTLVSEKKLPPKDVLAAIFALAEHDSSSEVREAALQIFLNQEFSRSYGVTNVLWKSTPILREDSEPRVKVQAARLLGEAGSLLARITREQHRRDSKAHPPYNWAVYDSYSYTLLREETIPALAAVRSRWRNPLGPTDLVSKEAAASVKKIRQAMRGKETTAGLEEITPRQSATDWVQRDLAVPAYQAAVKAYLGQEGVVEAVDANAALTLGPENATLLYGRPATGITITRVGSSADLSRGPLFYADGNLQPRHQLPWISEPDWDWPELRRNIPTAAPQDRFLVEREAGVTVGAVEAAITTHFRLGASPIAFLGTVAQHNAVPDATFTADASRLPRVVEIGVHFRVNTERGEFDVVIWV